MHLLFRGSKQEFLPLEPLYFFVWDVKMTAVHLCGILVICKAIMDDILTASPPYTLVKLIRHNKENFANSAFCQTID